MAIVERVAAAAARPTGERAGAQPAPAVETLRSWAEAMAAAPAVAPKALATAPQVAELPLQMRFHVCV